MPPDLAGIGAPGRHVIVAAVTYRTATSQRRLRALFHQALSVLRARLKHLRTPSARSWPAALHPCPDCGSSLLHGWVANHTDPGDVDPSARCTNTACDFSY